PSSRRDRSRVAAVIGPSLTSLGASLGRSLTDPLKPNHNPPARSRAARTATASPPWLGLSCSIGPTRLDTMTSRRGAATDETRAVVVAATPGRVSPSAASASLIAIRFLSGHLRLKQHGASRVP